MFERMNIAEQLYKGGKLYKPPLGNMPTVPVMTGNVREDKPPCQPTPKRAVLESARKIMQAIQVIGYPVKKYACCMAPDTL